MRDRKDTSPETISHHTSGGFLLCITSLSALFPLTGLRIMVMQHHMLCEEICADDPTMECPVKLNFLDVQAFELLWLPALLAVCVVLIATFLLRGVKSRPPLRDALRQGDEPAERGMRDVRHSLLDVNASTSLDLSHRDEGLEEDYIDMPVRARRIRLKKPPKLPPVKLQMNRYRTYPYDWMLERDARLAEKAEGRP